MNNNQILNCILYKDLGINFYKSLYFENHIDMCCAGSYNVFNRIFRSLLQIIEQHLIKRILPHV